MAKGATHSIDRFALKVALEALAYMAGIAALFVISGAAAAAAFTR
jgi:hypothetical protein